MNNIVNQFLLQGDKFMLEVHLRDPRVRFILHVDHLLGIKKEYKSLNKLEIQDIFTEMN